MVSNVIEFGGSNTGALATSPAGQLATAGLATAGQTEKEREYCAILFGLFEVHLRGTRALSAGSLGAALGVIHQFYRAADAPPWRWTPLDLDAFLSHQVKTVDVGLSRQSQYFTYLRAFQAWLLASPALCNEIQRRFGERPDRFVTAENAIAIKRKGKGRKRPAHAMTVEQIENLFATFDERIEQARRTHSKSWNSLRRDKTATMLTLLTGVRVAELTALRTTDFQSDSAYPQFGEYALVTVRLGKGRKQRVVRVYNPLIKELMDWYLNDVRPAFLKATTKDPYILFPSERGNALSDTQFRDSLAAVGAEAGISFKVCPHGLRHTYATHMAPVIGPRALQEQLGHEHLSTTLGEYYHPDPKKVGNEVALGVNTMLRLVESISDGTLDENFPL